MKTQPWVRCCVWLSILIRIVEGLRTEPGTEAAPLKTPDSGDDKDVAGYFRAHGGSGK